MANKHRQKTIFSRIGAQNHYNEQAMPHMEEPDFSRVEYNERILLEENLDTFEKYFPGLVGVPESLDGINTELPTKRDWAGLVALCSLGSAEDPAGRWQRGAYVTAQKLADFSGLFDIGKLYYRLESLYHVHNKDIMPNFEGARIGLFLKDVGFLDSNLPEFAGRGIEIGSADVTKKIRLPSEIDENVAWLSGMLSISSYSEGKKVEEDKVVNSYKRFRVSFKRDELDLIELEFLPAFEDLFNYRPYFDIKEGPVSLLDKKFDTLRYAIGISPKAVVSYFRDYIGIREEQEKRTVLFEEPNLKKAFICGIIDRCGHYEYRRKRPDIELNVPLKYPLIAEGLEEYFGKKFREGAAYRMRLFGVNETPEKIEEFGLRDPKWYLPLIENVKK